MKTVKETVEYLDSLQSQIIHGKRTFGEIADVIRELNTSIEMILKICNSTKHKDPLGDIKIVCQKALKLNQHEP